MFICIITLYIYTYVETYRKVSNKRRYEIIKKKKWNAIFRRRKISATSKNGES